MAETSNRPSVLLIEDDEDLREIQSFILTDAGFRVESLPPQEDPVDAARRTTPTVIVIHIDWRVPSGMTVIDRLQADPTTRRVPVVTIAMGEDTAARSQAGPNVHQAVVAPYDIAALEAAVIAALTAPPAAAVLPVTGQPIAPSVTFATGALSQQTRQIVLDTVQGLRDVEPYRSRFPELSRGLVDDLGKIVGAIAIGLQRGLSESDVFGVPEIRAQIRRHVQTRKHQQIGLATIVREYQTLKEHIDAFLQGLVGQSGFTAAGALDVSRGVQRYIHELTRLIIAAYPSTTETEPAP